MPKTPIILANGRVRLFNGSNSAIRVKADAVVSDPPYGINHKKGSTANSEAVLTDSKSISSTRKRQNRTVVGDHKPFDPLPFMQYEQVALTGAQHFYADLPRGGMIHAWDKRGEYRPLDQADADMVWIKKPIGKFKTSRVFHLVWRGICRHAENNQPFLHPTQKPIALMEWIISMLGLVAGSTIYDPYMGSGTTGIAALKMGFNFVGCEVCDDYFNTAITRITGVI